MEARAPNYPSLAIKIDRHPPKRCHCFEQIRPIGPRTDFGETGIARLKESGKLIPIRGPLLRSETDRPEVLAGVFDIIAIKVRGDSRRGMNEFIACRHLRNRFNHEACSVFLQHFLPTVRPAAAPPTEPQSS